MKDSATAACARARTGKARGNTVAAVRVAPRRWSISRREMRCMMSSSFSTGSSEGRYERTALDIKQNSRLFQGLVSAGTVA